MMKGRSEMKCFQGLLIVFWVTFFYIFNTGEILGQENPLKAIGRIFLSPDDTSSIGTAFVAGKSKSIYTCSLVVLKDTLWFSYIGTDFLLRIVVKYNFPNFDIAFLERTGGTQPYL